MWRKEQRREGKGEAIPPLSMANVEKTESPPHLPWWMLGQCKVRKELLGGLGEGWVAQDMEGLEVGMGADTSDSDIVITYPQDGWSLWDKFAWGVSVGIIRYPREYGGKWGGSKKAALGKHAEAKGRGEGKWGMAAITQARFYRGVAVALH